MHINNRCKIAFLTSHPIQYQAPLFKKLSEYQGVDLFVYFSWNFGINEPTFDSEFGKKIKWDIPLLKGYKYKFLKNLSLKSSSDFWGQINFDIIKELRQNKYDAILIFGWNSFTNWLAFFTAFIFKIPVLLRSENPFNQELLKSKWKIKIKKLVLGWLFKRISAFLYIGEENKKFYKFYGTPEEKLIFVPYAVDNERFIKAAQDLRFKIKDLRRELNIGEKDITILFVGKLIEKKRPMDLLRAYEKLKNLSASWRTEKLKNIALFFVGDGILRPELENYAKEHNLKNIHFVGFKNQTELSQYYIMADIFVLPSGTGETWGLAVNEAMCFGLPIIISDMVGCGSDLIKNEENGCIFPTGNVEKLAQCLEKLIKNSAKRTAFGKKSFEIIENYNYDKDIEGILKAINHN
ncbi:glycosyltransferase family 4 protein [Candidatus Wolfebacteria bacterium]|nr:glycosyltransferase family 4 protein [Candidatus Wolfebacteria bacterium]